MLIQSYARPVQRLVQLLLLAAAMLGASAAPTLAVMLVELKIDATARHYAPDNPVSSGQQDSASPTVKAR